jgi:hypothetical protein
VDEITPLSAFGFRRLVLRQRLLTAAQNQPQHQAHYRIVALPNGCDVHHFLIYHRTVLGGFGTIRSMAPTRQIQFALQLSF